MAEQSGTLERVAEAVGVALTPLEGLLAPDNLSTLLIELGLDTPPDLTGDAAFVGKLGDAVAKVLALEPQLEAVSQAVDNGDDSALIEAIGQLLVLVGQLAQALDDLATDFERATAGQPNAGELAAFAGLLVERIFENVLVRYLESNHRVAWQLLSLIALIEYTEIPVIVDGVPRIVLRRRLHFDRIGTLFSKPLDLLRDRYGWGTDTFDGKQLYTQLGDLCESLGPLGAFLDADDDGPAVFELFGVTFSTATDVHPPGINGVLNVDLAAGTDFTISQLSDNWRVALQIAGKIDGDTGIKILPPTTINIIPPAGTIEGDIGLRLIGAAPDGKTPFLIFGDNGGSRLQAVRVEAGVFGGVKWDIANNAATADIGFEAKFVQGKAIVDTSNSDGFIAKIVPEGGISLNFDFDLGWSEARGFFFTGSAGLETAIAINQTLGPFTLATIHLALSAGSDKLRIEASLDGSGELGPISASVERIGVALDLAFKRGNLGPVDLGVAFKPPTGLGIQIDAGPVTGGGFIEFDPDNGRYAGVLALSVYSISITAIGLLDTRLPGGQSGFSFLIIISVEFTPIQLGFGFTLNGVGGLAGINRTMVTAAIQAGIKTHSIDHILFPPDPVKNAPQIISDLRTIFPPAEGRYVFGPMAILGWGTPTLIEAELGIILEVPSPIVIAILGQLSMALPEKDAPVIELHLDVLGLIDFGKKLFSIDATLHDSRILVFTISGDMAMRLSWGDDPSFLFSIGGWNPHFQPPAGFPALQRLTLALGAGDDLRLTLQTYLAVSSNTFQIGAHLELYAGSGAFNVYGWLGFDALIIFSPFSFIVDFTAGLALRAGTSTIAGISVVGKLSGPTPWHVEGEAHFSILFFDISIHVSVTWGESRTNPLPATNAWTPLAAALIAQGSWSGALTRGTPQVVGLSAPEGTAAPVLIEPSGVLTLRQKVLPLDQKLTKFGEAVPEQQDEFDLTAVTLGGAPTPFTTITDLFARGQFAMLSDADKLSLPSFEPMVAGCTVGDQQIALGTAYSVEIKFETFIVDSVTAPARNAPRYPLKRAQLMAMSQTGAAARSSLRSAGLGKFAPDPRAPALVGLDDEQYVIAGIDDLQQRSDIAAPTTKGGAFAALSDHLATHPEDAGRLQVVPLYELTEAA